MLEHAENELVSLFYHVLQHDPETPFTLSELYVSWREDPQISNGVVDVVEVLSNRLRSIPREVVTEEARLFLRSSSQSSRKRSFPEETSLTHERTDTPSAARRVTVSTTPSMRDFCEDGLSGGINKEDRNSDVETTPSQKRKRPVELVPHRTTRATQLGGKEGREPQEEKEPSHASIMAFVAAEKQLSNSSVGLDIDLVSLSPFSGVDSNDSALFAPMCDVPAASDSSSSEQVMVVLPDKEQENPTLPKSPQKRPTGQRPLAEAVFTRCPLAELLLPPVSDLHSLSPSELFPTPSQRNTLSVRARQDHVERLQKRGTVYLLHAQYERGSLYEDVKARKVIVPGTGVKNGGATQVYENDSDEGVIVSLGLSQSVLAAAAKFTRVTDELAKDEGLSVHHVVATLARFDFHKLQPVLVELTKANQGKGARDPMRWVCSNARVLYNYVKQ